MTEADRLYFTAREEREREIAERTEDTSIARLHLRLADDYAQRLRAVGAQPIEASSAT